MAKRGGFPGGMPGNMNNLMKQAQRMQRQMEETAKELEEKEYTAACCQQPVSRRSCYRYGFWKKGSDFCKIIRRSSGSR